MNRPDPEKMTPLGDLPQSPVEGTAKPVLPKKDAASTVQLSPSMDESKSPQELVEWGLQHFADQPIVMTSSFGMEGCMLMDLCSKAIAKHDLEKLTIACIDTGFFFPETKTLQKKLIERYANLNFVTWETPVSIQQQAESYGPNLWQYNPNLCCNIRKVQPMSENVVNYNVWITAVRRSQTASRANTPVIGWDWRYQLLKFCPLVTLARADVWKYIQTHDVPFNQLHLQNYPSVSCFHCTKAVPGSSPESDARGGRWSDTDKDECGLHYQI
jgi:phosphoadenosine phosphosulfate reductase